MNQILSLIRLPGQEVMACAFRLKGHGFKSRPIHSIKFADFQPPIVRRLSKKILRKVRLGANKTPVGSLI
jgi:hypothetical protein